MSGGALEILRAEGADAARWREALAGMPGADVYFTPEYTRLFARLDGDEPLALYQETSRGRVLFPLQIRDLARLPFRIPSGVAATHDATSPYGYSGPLTDCPAGPEASEIIENFMDEARQALGARGVVSLFIRFHPLVGNVSYFPADAREPARRSETVYLDLATPWYKGLSSACRYEVRKSERRGVQVAADDSPAAWAAFGDLYRETMRRRNAREWYVFPQTFLDETRRTLGRGVTLLLARREGRILGGSLFLEGFGKGHYHLSGTSADAAGLGVANRLLVEGARLCEGRGCTTLHLGGGVGADDGLLRFKSSFSPLRAIWEKAGVVLDPAAYAALVDANRKFRRQGGERPQDASSGSFPAYREGL